MKRYLPLVLPALIFFVPSAASASTTCLLNQPASTCYGKSQAKVAEQAMGKVIVPTAIVRQLAHLPLAQVILQRSGSNPQAITYLYGHFPPTGLNPAAIAPLFMVITESRTQAPVTVPIKREPPPPCDCHPGSAPSPGPWVLSEPLGTSMQLQITANTSKAVVVHVARALRKQVP